jgi:glutamine cyclotransferase
MMQTRSLSLVLLVIALALAVLAYSGLASESVCSTRPLPWPFERGTAHCAYTIINTYPHDTGAYTEGLQYVDGVLYESTGWFGQFSIRKVALESGEILQRFDRADLPPEYFGEGITLLGDELYQVTWQAREGFVYARDSFAVLKTFNYDSEGWGLTHDGQRLIMSDGTATLHFIDPETLTETGRVEVRDQNGPVEKLNELEYIHGSIYANVWQTDRIARIDPQTGAVTAWIDLSGLGDPSFRVNPDAVLNGIAYDAQNDRLFVAGKLWPSLFEITLRLAP